MLDTDTHARHEAILATLAHRAGGPPDAGAVAAATLATWHEVAARLAPVIGLRGFDILFRRALHLTSTDFPWLATAGDHADSAAPLADLGARLAGHAPDAAAAANHALLVTFTELLGTLIGASLTGRLLGQVRASASELTEQETA